MKNILIVFFAILFATSCSSQQATTKNDAKPPQEGQRQNPPSVDEIFKQMDANNDNQLAKTEVKGPLANDFDKIDTDKNGFISKAELEKAPKPKRGQGQRPPRQ